MHGKGSTFLISVVGCPVNAYFHIMHGNTLMFCYASAVFFNYFVSFSFIFCIYIVFNGAFSENVYRIAILDDLVMWVHIGCCVYLLKLLILGFFRFCWFV